MINRFILTSDWHLRKDLPRCRKDKDWYLTQENALCQIVDLANERDCPVFVVGDIFHRPNEFEMVKLVQDTAISISKGLFYLAGNHDLRFHSSINSNQSAITLLEKSINCFKLSLIEDIFAPDFDKIEDSDKEFVFIHTLCFPHKEDIPYGSNGICANDLLNKYKNSKYICTGDYHYNFHINDNGRHVINSGCLLRQTSDMKDYKCCIYYIENDNISKHYIIDDEELVDDSYILKEKENDEMIDKFVNKLKDTESITLDFIENVEKAMIANKLPSDIESEIRSLINVQQG